MGRKTGRPPKPSALKALAGNPGKRKINRREPKPKTEIPTPPEVVMKNAIAFAEWKRITPKLNDLGVISKIDRAALAAYCVTFARWFTAETDLNTHLANGGDLFFASPNGYPQQHPLIGIANQAAKLMKEFIGEFGLSPSSRSTVKIPELPKKSALAEFARAKPTLAK